MPLFAQRKEAETSTYKERHPMTTKTKTYSDGTTVTGTAPLPPYSPKEQEILYLALEVAQKAWDGKCEYAEIEGLAWNLRNQVRDLLEKVGMPLEPTL